MVGDFSLFLHSHIPYCRKSGVWPAGEEWLFEAMMETYIPLLQVLSNWKRDRVPARLTLGIVPILAEQLADDHMRRGFVSYLQDRISRAESEIKSCSNLPERKHVAEYWLNRLQAIQASYLHDFDSDLIGAMAWLQNEGVCELSTSAATHGFLPLLTEDSSIRAQVQTGVDSHKRHFGRSPVGFWLPECAYRPSDAKRKGIDEFLIDAGIRYTLVENVGITGARLVEGRDRALTTDEAYQLESGLLVYGRNMATGKQVWSPEGGYPGDPYYLDFHSRAPESGLRAWRVTGGDEKEVYDPEAALERVQNHARHFVALVRSEMDRAVAEGQAKPVIVSPYDTELFGHWWHEGVAFIDQVYRQMAVQLVQTKSLGDVTSERQEKSTTIRMSASTWGLNSDFTVWQNEEHGWIWPLINGCSRDFKNLLETLDLGAVRADSRGQRILMQLGRELLLMQGSDWPFLLFTKQAKEYANQRFHHHHQRFCRLLWAGQKLEDQQRLSEHDLAEIEEIDRVWSELELAYFKDERSR